MQDIRKPYTRSKSKSSQTINSRVEEFESNSYSRDDGASTVRIPIDRGMTRSRRNLDEMEMYPRRASHHSSLQESRDEPARPDIAYRDPRTRYKRKGMSSGTVTLLVTSIILVAGAGLLTYVFNSAAVTIIPKHVDISDFHAPLVFGLNATGTESIPFIVATSSITKSRVLSLSESRKVEAKASGKIVVYNNFDTNPQKLIKGTRFESSSSKIYRINQSIVVPGKSGDKPGSIAVTVYADSYGADYNSVPTDFTIPGFKGSTRYKGFFARSDGSISGGSSGSVSIASLSDVNAAKDELALELAQEIKTDMAKIQKEGYIGMYSAAEITYADNQQDILSGVTSTYTVTATGHVMLAESGALARAVASDIRDYENEPVRLGYADTLVYTKKDTDHIATSTSLSILVEGKPRVIWMSDEEALKKAVAGKSRSDFKPVMKTINSIEGAEISFSPLWLSSFPEDQNKITIIESLPKR